MANTFELINSYTAGSAVSSITFSSIPATFTDLVIKLSVRTTRTSDYGDDINIRFNGNSTGYSGKTVMGFGSGGISSLNVSGSEINRTSTSDDANTSSTFGNFEIYIPNYASSNGKSVSIDTVGENNASTAMMNLTAGLWSNSAAITSVTFTPGVGPNFTANSTAYLYGVKNA